MAYEPLPPTTVFGRVWHHRFGPAAYLLATIGLILGLKAIERSYLPPPPLPEEMEELELLEEELWREIVGDEIKNMREEIDQGEATGELKPRQVRWARKKIEREEIRLRGRVRALALKTLRTTRALDEMRRNQERNQENGQE